MADGAEGADGESGIVEGDAGVGGAGVVEEGGGGGEGEAEGGVGGGDEGEGVNEDLVGIVSNWVREKCEGCEKNGWHEDFLELEKVQTYPPYHPFHSSNIVGRPGVLLRSPSHQLDVLPRVLAVRTFLRFEVIKMVLQSHKFSKVWRRQN